ncbi:MBL fold metallo-hydrolase [Lysinibacillus sp. PLM2]|nr:MBL fold metallo-hydrolase [Lysinibacillus sp. PLM2]
MDEQLNYGNDYKFIPMTSILSGIGKEITSDIFVLTIQVVNVCFVGDKKDWTLIDAGMPKSADTIIQEAENRFGPNARPNAIVLTHGHFDHVGAVIELIKHWNVPVYAHELEIPYLTGQKKYPEADTSVEGGLVARMSFYFPNDPIHLGSHVQPLPKDGTIPGLSGWKWIPTPGHSPGHVSLFRENDRALIVGDAFVTVKQESLFKVLVQEKEISGPPRYFTINWNQARESVQKLSYLNPTIAVTGHGIPMAGEELKENLAKLAKEFDEIAKPKYGRYIHEYEN